VSEIVRGEGPGRDLEAEHFKPAPEGQTAGPLNVAIAYVGHLTGDAVLQRRDTVKT
jgi:hypothetical protein